MYRFIYFRDFGKKFDLHYYDGLANQDEAIVLTIGKIDFLPILHNVYTCIWLYADLLQSRCYYEYGHAKRAIKNDCFTVFFGHLAFNHFL